MSPGMEKIPRRAERVNPREEHLAGSAMGLGAT